MVVPSNLNGDFKEQILSKLHDVKESLLSDSFLLEASEYASFDLQELQEYITISLEEANLSLELISRYDMQDKSVLEFGAGLGIASIALYLVGIKIVAFEPSGLGFEKNYLLNEFIKNYFQYNFKTQNDIDAIEPESFDIIFSNNVLEHVEDPYEVLRTLHLILKNDGVMIHNVANYLVPYEPHFAIPLVPLLPELTSYVLPKKITSTGLWRSLNFIDYFDVKRIAKKDNAKLNFRQGLLYQAFDRLFTDVEYAKRHVFFTKIARVASNLKLLIILKYIPAFLSTPMVFEWKK